MLQTNLKLSNVLYRFDEFYDETLKIELSNDSEEKFFELSEQWHQITDVALDGVFEPSENIDLSLEILEEILTNFRYFKNIFDYSVEEILQLCPASYIENYPEVYKTLVKIYGLEKADDENIEFNYVSYLEDDTLSVGVKTNQQIDDFEDFEETNELGEKLYGKYFILSPGESLEKPEYGGLSVKWSTIKVPKSFSKHTGWDITANNGFNEFIEYKE